MESHRVGGGLLATVAVVGPSIAEMMRLTVPPIYGYPLLGLCAGAALTGLWLVIRPNKRSFQAQPDQSSTTIRARGRGRVELEDFYSGADTFADVEEDASAAAQRGVHNPRNLPKRLFPKRIRHDGERKSRELP